MPSKRWPRTTSSIESAITSRLMSDAFIPSVPMETPSLMEIVLNSMGVPPAARIPTLTNSARRRWLKLHGIVSIHVVATPINGRARSSSVNPIALSMARAAARSGPSVSAALWRLAGSVSYTHLRAHETRHDLVCRLLLEKKKKRKNEKKEEQNQNRKKKNKEKKNEHT